MGAPHIRIDRNSVGKHMRQPAQDRVFREVYSGGPLLPYGGAPRLGRALHRRCAAAPIFTRSPRFLVNGSKEGLNIAVLNRACSTGARFDGCQACLLSHGL